MQIRHCGVTIVPTQMDWTPLEKAMPDVAAEPVAVVVANGQRR